MEYGILNICECVRARAYLCGLHSDIVQYEPTEHEHCQMETSWRRASSMFMNMMKLTTNYLYTRIEVHAYIDVCTDDSATRSIV